MSSSAKPTGDRAFALRALAKHLEIERAFGVRGLPMPAEPQGPVGDATSPSAEASPAPEAAPTDSRPAAAATREAPPPEAGSAVEAPAASKRADLEAMSREVAGCTRCPLAKTRNQTVFGEGNPDSDLMLIGEAPGAEEDRTGRPFVGKAGQLLTKILAAIGLERDEVFIANVLKCRPPGNRNPGPDEVACCFPFLAAQIETVRPRVICTLGAPATRTVLQTERGIGAMRGRTHDYEGIVVVPTYHPAYLLRNPADKVKTWHDIQLVQKLLQQGA